MSSYNYNSRTNVFPTNNPESTWFSTKHDINVIAEAITAVTVHDSYNLEKDNKKN